MANPTLKSLSGAIGKQFSVRAQRNSNGTSQTLCERSDTIDLKFGAANLETTVLDGPKGTSGLLVTYIPSWNQVFQHDRTEHRLDQQVWNVRLLGFEDVSIWVQGGAAARFQRDTTFAKKHLLSFKGGSAHQRGGKEREKMLEIWKKRLSPNNAADAKRAEDGGQVRSIGLNTMIRCDRFPTDQTDPGSLPQMFGMALKHPIEKPSLGHDMGHATVELCADQIWTGHESERTSATGGRRFEVATQGDPSRLCQVTFGYMQCARNTFQIFHLVNMKQL